jgi:hypothetical protein
VRGEQIVHPSAVDNVERHEPKIGQRSQLSEPGLGQSRIAGAGRIVETEHGLPVRQEAARHMHADESRGAGHQDGVGHDVLRTFAFVDATAAFARISSAGVEVRARGDDAGAAV